MKKRLRDLVVLMVILSLTITPVFGETIGNEKNQPTNEQEKTVLFSIDNTFLVNSVDHDKQQLVGVLAGIPVGDLLAGLTFDESVKPVIVNKDFEPMKMGDAIDGTCSLILEGVARYTFIMQESSSDEEVTTNPVTSPSPTTASFTVSNEFLVKSIDHDKKQLIGVLDGIPVGDLLSGLKFDEGLNPNIINSEYVVMEMNETINGECSLVMESIGRYTFVMQGSSSGNPDVTTSPSSSPLFTISNPFLVKSVDLEQLRLIGVLDGIPAGDLLSALALRDGVTASVTNQNGDVIELNETVDSNTLVKVSEGSVHTIFTLSMQSDSNKVSPRDLNMRILSTRGFLNSDLDNGSKVYVESEGLIDILDVQNISAYSVKNSQGNKLTLPANIDEVSTLEVVSNEVDGKTYTFEYSIVKIEPFATVNGMPTVFDSYTHSLKAFFGVKENATIGDWLNEITIRDGVRLISFSESDEIISVDNEWLIKDNQLNKLYYELENEHLLFNISFQMKNVSTGTTTPVDPPSVGNKIVTTNSAFSYSISERKLNVPSPLTVREVIEGIDLAESKITSISATSGSNSTLIYDSNRGMDFNITYADGERITINVLPVMGYPAYGVSGVRYLDYDNRTAKFDNYHSFLYSIDNRITDIEILDKDERVLLKGNHKEITEDVYLNAKKAVITFFDNRKITFDLSPWNGYVVSSDDRVVRKVSSDGSSLYGVKTGITIESFANALTLSDGVKLIFKTKENSVISNYSSILNKNVEVWGEYNGISSKIKISFDIPLTSQDESKLVIENDFIYLSEVMRPSDIVSYLSSNGQNIIAVEKAHSDDQNEAFEVNTLEEAYIIVGDYHTIKWVGVSPGQFIKNMNGLGLSIKSTEEQNAGLVVMEQARFTKVFIPENSTYVFDLKALDNEGNEIADVDKLSISAPKNLSATFDSSTKKLTIETGLVEHGEKENKGLIFSLGQGSVPIEVTVYKGNLAYLTLNDSKGNLYDGEVRYSLDYDMKEGTDRGTNTIDYVYNGKLYIPVSVDIADLAYSSVIVAPKIASESNTKVIELTELFNKVSDTQVKELGEFDFQVPTHYIRVLNDDSTLNEMCTVTIRQGKHRKDGSYEYIGVSLPNMNGVSYYAPMFDSIVNEASIEVDSNDDNIPDIPSATYDLSKSPEITMVIGNDNLAITVLTPEGQTIEEAGLNKLGKDIGLRRFKDGGSSTTEFVHSGVVKSIVEFEDGKSYRFAVVTDEGDFIQENYEASLPFNITYHSTEGDYVGTFDDGKSFNYHIDSKGKVTCSIPLRKADFYGYVLGNSKGIEGVKITIVDPSSGEEVGAATSRNYNAADGSTLEGYFIARTTKTLQGEYLVKYSAPEKSLDYLAGEELVTFPLTTSHSYEMKVSSIKGAISIDDVDREAYKNKIARVYINVFTDFGEYVTNGRVMLNGEFAISDLAPGSYYAEAYVSPYSTLAGRYTSSNSIHFLVSAEKNATDIRVPLKKVGAKGLVVDKNGRSYGKRWITLFKDGNPIYYVESNNEGEFYLPICEKGDYEIKAYGNDGELDSNLKTISLDPNTYNDQIWLSLNEEAQISGTLFRTSVATGSAQVVVCDESMNKVTSKQVVDNKYAISGLPSGNYYIYGVTETGLSSLMQMVTVSEDNKETVDVVFGDSVISGKVILPNGQATTEAWVIVKENGEFVTLTSVQNDGSFLLALDSGKEYEVYASSNMGLYGDSEIVAINSNELLTLTLSERHDIYGILSKNHVSLPNREILIYTSDKKPVAVIRTSIVGSFYLDHLSAGEYHFFVKNDDGTYSKLIFDYDGIPTEKIFDIGGVN